MPCANTTKGSYINITSTKVDNLIILNVFNSGKCYPCEKEIYQSMRLTPVFKTQRHALKHTLGNLERKWRSTNLKNLLWKDSLIT